MGAQGIQTSRSEGGLKLVCVSLEGWTPSGVAATNSPSLGFSMPVIEDSLQELAYVGTYPIWGLGPTLGLDSWGGGGFFNFLKILPPFVKGMEAGKSIRYQVVVPGRGRGVHCHVSLLSLFSNWGFLLLSGVRTFLIRV